MRTQSDVGRFALAVLGGCLLSPALDGVGMMDAQSPATAARASSPGVLTTLDTSQLRGLRYRMIGPARGGRVTTVTGVPQEAMTFYMGSTGGGVWKTTNSGITWTNVSDGFFDAASMGSIDVADSDPNVIYAGTGSEAIRSNVSVGRGIYKSTDAGKSWTHTGLRDAGQIGSIVIHPTNPEVVFAAAVGNPFKPTSERGVYRTRDGARSWRRVLFISDSTGAVDIELQPGNPNVVYAVMWRAERKPWTIISGAREGGIYKSTDGGDTWSRLGGGLPNGLVGKADLAVSAAKPDRLYVLIEASPGSGLYRSDDAGRWFIAVDTTTRGLITRPFYYTNIDADPNNADVLYVGTESFYKSTDGGKTWRTMSTPHGDNHDLWINPRNSSIMIPANDGGANVSLDGGRSWSTQYNQPTAEIYQVYVDNQFPYRVYGAQQDNSTLIVPSFPATAQAPDDPIQSWRSGPGCETGPIMPHRVNPDTVYGGCKGLFSRMSLRTGQERQYWIGAQSLYGNPGKDLIFRFQRVSPMEVSPHDPRTLYFGSQYVHRTRDEGVRWERISPDLTWNPPERQQRVSGEPITIDVTGEEVYSTLYAIRESPLQRGLIWTGSNDGPFHVTRNDGNTWSDVTPPAQPKGCRVQNIEPSPHRAASAYYAVLCYLLGDFRPYLWRTDNYGTSWTLLTTGSNGIPADFPTRVIREDPEREGLLYAGTEFGAFVSFDNGARWQSLQLNLPVTPITDMKIQRGDLVLSTQGRSFWILDNVAPLRQLTDRMTSQNVRLLKPRDTYRILYRATFGGDESVRASSGDPQYPPPGAMIDYWLGPGARGPLTLDIVDGRGSTVRSFSSLAAPDSAPQLPVDLRVPSLASAGTPTLATNRGLNRIVWGLSYPGPWDPNPRRSGRNGPMITPGSYTVRLSMNGATETQTLTVRADPRVSRDGVTTDVLRAQLADNIRVRDLVSDANLAVAHLQSIRRRLSTTGQAGGEQLRRLEALERTLVTPPIRYSRPALQAHIQYLYTASMGADQKVGRDAQLRYVVLRKEMDAALNEVRRLLEATSAR
jgi:photosystem II stability/assembly factor-like uncharacterized protein